jgi:hypothetical protein
MKKIYSIIIVFILVSIYFASKDSLGKNMCFLITACLLLFSFLKYDEQNKK